MAKVRVLVVEDSPIMAIAVEETLSRLGLELVGSAATQAEAIEKVDRHAPDMVFLDAELRDGWCVSVAEHLDRTRVPYAMMSAYYPDELPDALRAKPLLGKPFRDETVLDLLHALFPGRFAAPIVGESAE